MVSISPELRDPLGSAAQAHVGPLKLTSIQRRFLIGILAVLLTTRVLLIFWLPITDTTEARYAEIARKMIETGNWITPQFDYGVPFWGKPPLHTWVTAIGMNVFGVGHFGARLPILLLSIAVLLVNFIWSRRQSGSDQSLVGAVVLASSVLFFGASAFVMTDMALMLGTTLCMAAFFISVAKAEGRSGWGYLFFVGLAIGLLAKGPVASILTGIPIFLWLLLGNRWHRLPMLPWKPGLLVLAVLTLPWYLAAEAATPGFLRYFLIGEHFERYLVSGWRGDLYGSGHAEPLGMIWGFALGAFLPWTIFAGALVLKQTSVSTQLRNDKDGWYSYLFLWCLSPLILFTPAANILPAYSLPALPAAALLLTSMWARVYGTSQKLNSYLILTTTMTVAALYLCLSVTVWVSPHQLNLRSEKHLVEQAYSIDPDIRLTYWGGRSYSAEFYSAGAVRTATNISEIANIANNNRRDAIAVFARDLPDLPPFIPSNYEDFGRIGRRHLLIEPLNAREGQ